VVGGGHAGCEAAHAAASMGAKTLLLTMNLDTIGKMSCNPAIGGTAKGQMVREIDALGGIMGKMADRTAIQYRMLNRTKGPAVWSPRCQSDRALYAIEMKKHLENLENLDIHQATVTDLLVENDVVVGVLSQEGIEFRGNAVILCSGTFMRGKIHIGDVSYSAGRAGDKPSIGLSKSLEDLGIRLGRLKTGTPPRIHADSIDTSVMEEQPGEDDVRFSFDENEPRLKQVSCYITYTTERTKELIQKNLHKSAMYSGRIDSVGPRYCPSIEDKIVRFSDKERHQIFIEPEGLHTKECYINGISTSLPYDVQVDMIRSVIGIENAKIMRPAYAIEYDYLLSGQVNFTLECRNVKQLYIAGQLNGTTGYEEAAAQGMMAAINAVHPNDPLILRRSEAYIGVMIEEITTKEITEPYRMFTSRAEHRLLLRGDNADLRLRHYGHKYGLISDSQMARLQQKKDSIAHVSTLLEKRIQRDEKSVLLSQVLSRPEISYASLQEEFPYLPLFDEEIHRQIELKIKYAGYIKRQQQTVEKMESLDGVKIPEDFDYLAIEGLRNEAQEKLFKMRPPTLGSAGRLHGVSSADISILIVYLRK